MTKKSIALLGSLLFIFPFFVSAEISYSVPPPQLSSVEVEFTCTEGTAISIFDQYTQLYVTGIDCPSTYPNPEPSIFSNYLFAECVDNNGSCWTSPNWSSVQNATDTLSLAGYVWTIGDLTPLSSLNTITGLIFNFSIILGGIVLIILTLLGALIGLRWGVQKFQQWVTSDNGQFGHDMGVNYGQSNKRFASHSGENKKTVEWIEGGEGRHSFTLIK